MVWTARPRRRSWSHWGQHHQLAVQLLYRKYAIAIDSILGTDYLGLAAENDLIRLAAPANVYAAVVTMTNDAAADIYWRDATRLLYVSLQVDAGSAGWAAAPRTLVSRRITPTSRS